MRMLHDETNFGIGTLGTGYVASRCGARYGRPMRDNTHFGFREVPLAEKQALVDDVFHKVAQRYDLMNDVMAGGLNGAGEAALAPAITPQKSGRDFALLDVAGGTGDISFRTVRAGGP